MVTKYIFLSSSLQFGLLIVFTFYLSGTVFTIFSVVLPHTTQRLPILYHLNLHSQQNTNWTLLINLRDIWLAVDRQVNHRYVCCSDIFVKSNWFIYFMVEELLQSHIWVDCAGKRIVTSIRGSEDAWRGRWRVSGTGMIYVLREAFI